MESHRTSLVFRNLQELGRRAVDSYQKILNFLRTTTTNTGLAVSAYLGRAHYPTGLSLDPLLFRSIRVRPQDTTGLGLHDHSQSVKLFLRGPLGAMIIR